MSVGMILGLTGIICVSAVALYLVVLVCTEGRWR